MADGSLFVVLFDFSFEEAKKVKKKKKKRWGEWNDRIVTGQSAIDIPYNRGKHKEIIVFFSRFCHIL